MCWRTERIESAGHVAEKEFVHTFLKIQESLFFESTKYLARLLLIGPIRTRKGRGWEVEKSLYIEAEE